jgi:hypothetical protein
MSQVHDYTFGELKVRVQGLGVYFGGKYLTEACDKLTPQQLKAANQEAWRQKHAAERAMNRFANVSVYGNLAYDTASARYDVASVVCKETWQRMQKM